MKKEDTLGSPDRARASAAGRRIPILARQLPLRISSGLRGGIIAAVNDQIGIYNTALYIFYSSGILRE